MKNTSLYLPIVLLLSGASMYACEVAKQQGISKLNTDTKLILTEKLTKKFTQDQQKSNEMKIHDVILGNRILKDTRVVEIEAPTIEKQVIPVTMKAEVENTQPQAIPTQYLADSIALRADMTLEDLELKKIEAKKAALLQKEEKRRKSREEKRTHLIKRVSALESAMTGKGLNISTNETEIQKLYKENKALQESIDSDAKKLAEHNNFLNSLQTGQIQQAANVPAEALVVAAIVEAKPEAAPVEVKKGSWNLFGWGSKSTKETPKVETPVVKEAPKSTEVAKVETPKTPIAKQADGKTK